MVHCALQMLLSFGHGLPYLIPIAQQVTKITQLGATRSRWGGGWGAGEFVILIGPVG